MAQLAYSSNCIVKFASQVKNYVENLFNIDLKGNFDQFEWRGGKVYGLLKKIKIVKIGISLENGAFECDMEWYTSKVDQRTRTYYIKKIILLKQNWFNLKYGYLVWEHWTHPPRGIKFTGEEYGIACEIATDKQN